METVIYDRKKLYQEVWKEPVSIVAKRYGVTDVALAKNCRKLNVPLPPRGYWAKIQAGAKLKKIPLPKYKGRDKIIVNKDEKVKVEKKEDKLSFLPEDVKEYLKTISAPDRYYIRG